MSHSGDPHDMVLKLAALAAPTAAHTELQRSLTFRAMVAALQENILTPWPLPALAMQHVSCFRCREPVAWSRGGIPCLHDLFTPPQGQLDASLSPEAPAFVAHVTPDLAPQVLAGCYFVREGHQLYLPGQGWRWLQ